MSDFTIDKNIPIPSDKKGRTGKVKYNFPFDSIEIGDSFLVVGDQAEIRTAKSNAYNSGRRTGKKFISRIDGDGVRFWRIE